MKRNLIHIIIILIISSSGYAQESVLSLLRSDVDKADDLFEKSAYSEAIEIYKTNLKRNNNEHAQLMLARSFYELSDCAKAAHWYQLYLDAGGELNDADILKFATALHGNGHYENAIEWYRQYLKRHKDNIEISSKIWQLQNIKYLYEDSMFYDISKLPINTEYDEFGPTVYQNKIIFISNRPQVEIINRVDASTKKAFTRWYVSNLSSDSISHAEPDQPKSFAYNIKSKYHKGYLSFDENESIMVYSKTEKSNHNSGTSSKVYFAKLDEKGNWKEYEAFPNSDTYSIYHPHIANGGITLYFTSDMPGGLGGTDLYSSDFINGGWSKPENLGSVINTSMNEGHPFISGHQLYFSSNGHPGLGGLDVFEVSLEDKQKEIINLGYPVNTHFDDFGLVLDSAGLNGYLVSNRTNSNQLTDNIYKLNITKRSFPLMVEGKVSYKRSASGEIELDPIVLINAKLELIDKSNQNIVGEVYTDDSGNFKLIIPYESQYLLKVNKTDFGTAIVSMEIPRNYQNYLNHDIVIVENLFK